MGQHKYNPTAIAAKEGKLPPKQKPMSKKEREAMLRGAIIGALVEQAPGTAAIMAALNESQYGYFGGKGNV